MDFEKLHEPYKDENSPSPELQVKWLRKFNIPDHVIDQAMISVYTEIEQKEKTFQTGAELNLYLKEIAKRLHTEELGAYIRHLEKFEAKLKKKWQQHLPWYKRMLGIKK